MDDTELAEAVSGSFNWLCGANTHSDYSSPSQLVFASEYSVGPSFWYILTGE